MIFCLFVNKREKITLSNKQSRGKRAITKKRLKQHEKCREEKQEVWRANLAKRKREVGLGKGARHEAQWEVIATDRSVLKALCK